MRIYLCRITAQNVEWNDSNTKLLISCSEIDWPTKFAIMDYLQIPSTSYSREIPIAIYDILSDLEKKQFVPVDDAETSLQNYLTSIFELALIAEELPDEFINNAYKFQEIENIGDIMAINFYLAFSNVINLHETEITQNVLKVIGKLYKIFDGHVDLNGAFCSYAVFEGS